MPSLSTQRELRSVSVLPFCYICGNYFTEGADTDGDHVPPKTCFDKRDRNIPLKLKTHRECNGKFNLIDEQIGQVISLKRGTIPPVRNRRLAITRFFVPSRIAPISAINNLDIRGAVRRWVSGFHAALYQEPMPGETQFGIETPFPSARFANRGIQIDQLRPQHRLFVDILKTNRAANNVDRISTNNRKMVYECVWIKSDNAEEWICIFALDIYGWKDMGDVHNFAPRGCAGFYQLPSCKAPSSTTLWKIISTQLPNYSPLDPFGK